LQLIEGGRDAGRRGGDDGRPLLLHVVSGRADLVTIAPVAGALRRLQTFRQATLHIGSESLDAGDLQALAMPTPECEVLTASTEGGTSTAVAMATAESLLARFQPAVVVVTGSSNAAFACALAATQANIPVARVEAGLRGHDWSVPEQVNRVLLDTIADSLFVASEPAAAALAAERVDQGRIHLVGSTAVDSVRRVLGESRARSAWRDHVVEPGRYVVTIVRRALNDDERLARLVEALATLARDVPVLFPVTPGAARRLEMMGDGYRLEAAGVRCISPLPYIDCVSLLSRAGAVVTDSGIIQEECTALGVQCYTLGSSTERVITTTHGTNTLLGDDPREIAEIAPSASEPTPCAIPLWDGRAGERIAATLVAGYALVRAV
jgi:UDP-N-acetylglucosamine 2-epimerase (non-hydrolysing)